MKRNLFRLFALGAFFVAFGCDKGGYHPFGKLTDVVVQTEQASVFLHSSADGTDMVLFGRSNPLDVVAATEEARFITGKVMRDSSTKLYYGTYELAADGTGLFHLLSVYTFNYEPHLSVAAREGALRDDYPPGEYNYPISVTQTGSGMRIVVDSFAPTNFVYSSLDDVMTAIDVNGPTAYYDTYQLFNFALFFSQVRIPAFGGLGMTRYITTPGNFNGIVSGTLNVSVDSIAMPTARLNYSNFQDFRGIWVNGPQITKVNISGDGPMEGVLDFEFRRQGDPTDVVISGSVDYSDITVKNGVGFSGDYIVTIDGVGQGIAPITAASNVELTNILPVTP